jgi:type I restriction enzyme S subunit
MKKIMFKNFIKLQRGFDLPKTDMRVGNIPVFGSTSIIGHHDDFKVKAPGVITGRSGSLGKIQFSKKNYWPHNTSLWVKDFKGNYPKYVYYFLQEMHLEKFNAGAGVPTLNRNHLDNYEILIHQYSEQQKIVTILSNYDDLIDNNIKRIELLEKTAKLIYEEWFVNFKFPGYKNVKLIDSKIGKIPNTWKVISFEEILKLKKVKFKEENYILPLLDLSKIPKRSLRIPAYGKFEDITTSRIIFNKFDILFGSIRPYLHKVVCASEKGITNVSVFVLESKNKKNILFNIMNLSSDKTISIATAKSQGTKMPVIKWGVLSKELIAYPGEILIDKYNELCFGLLEEIFSLSNVNKNLEKTRDLLLPKLISGIIDVSNLNIGVSEGAA